MILGAYAPFSRPVWRWFFLAAGLFSALAAMAVGINAEWLTTLDTSVETWIEADRSRRWLVDAQGWFRFVGQPVHVASAAVVCGGLLSLRARSMMPVVLVTGGVGFGVAVEQVFKALVTRTSTAVAELQQRSVLQHFEHAFPSGHVTGSAALLGLIAVCLGVGRSRAVRVALAVPVVAGVMFVAFVALYSRAHTFTDVIGGVLLGGAVVSLGAGLVVANSSRRAAAPVNELSRSYN